MSIIKEGDTVTVHYTGTLTSGEVFDSSKDREPLSFTLGQGQLIAGFEKAVIGLSVGDTTTTNIPANEAYGERNPEMIVEVPKNQLPTEIEAKVSMQLQLNQPNGQAIPVQITEVNEDTITIDANHPLAGKNLSFEIEIVSIQH